MQHGTSECYNALTTVWLGICVLVLGMCIAEMVRVVEVQNNLPFVRASEMKIYTQRWALGLPLCV